MAVLAELGFNVTTIIAGTSAVVAAVAFGTPEHHDLRLSLDPPMGWAGDGGVSVA